MKLSLNWVKQYTDVELPVEELVELAVSRLGGVEGYNKLSQRYKNVVVAKVVSCESHPNADKLSLCLIDDGGVNQDVERDQDEYIQVVCGAPNVKTGQLVAWIPPQATVPSTVDSGEPFVVDSRELRGEMSHGMIASSKELGLSDEHQGILVIEEDGAKPGQAFSELYELDDVVIDIENKMFTHRPDGFGQLGVAREIAGIQHLAFNSPDWYNQNPELPTGGSSESIKGLTTAVDVPELCPRFMAICLEGIEVKASPPWLQSRLVRAGVTPRNNVVDITNYIMLLTAQPIHAFDFDKIAKNGKAAITVRKPKPAEQLTLLNEQTITPHDDAILICNDDGPIGLGGVMGGANSEIDESTTRIVVECANFNMYSIRRTSMIHGLFTDAVTRFSKGQSPAQLPAVLSEAVRMLTELSGAKIVGEATDVNHRANYTNPTIKVSGSFTNQRLGTDISVQDMHQLLENVEFIVERNADTLEVTAPFWRTDIEIKEDIVEEIGRLHGFDALPRALPKRKIMPAALTNLEQGRRLIRSELETAGVNEVVSHSFVNGELLLKADQKPDQAFEIANALSKELQYYRLTPLPGLLNLVHANIKAGHEEFILFEIATTHNKAAHQDDDNGLPKELHFLDLVYAAKNSRNGAAFYQIRATLETVISRATNKSLVFKPIKDEIDYAATAPFDQARTALVETSDGKFLGVVGELKPAVKANFKLPEYCAAASLDLDAVIELITDKGSAYKPLPKFPSVTQDITLKCNQSVPYLQLHQDLFSEIDQQLTETQVVHTETLGIYRAEDSNQKQITWRVSMVDDSATLKADVVNDLLDKAAATLDYAVRV